MHVQFVTCRYAHHLPLVTASFLAIYFPSALISSFFSHFYLSTPCPEKRDRQYFGRNFDKFRQLFIIFDTNHPDNPCDWKIVKYPINTCTKLRDDDIIVTSLKNAVLGSVSEKKRTDSTLGITLTNLNIYIYSCNFCKEYREECETTNTTKVRLT